MARGTLRTARGFDRLAFFSDAVVAIAITLLILPLVDAVSDTSEQTAGGILRDNAGRLFAFALSFVVIARYWIAHHQLFEAIDGYDVRLLWMNTLWLGTIVFLPFPTELLAVQGADDAGARALYIGSVLVTSAVLSLIQLVVSRSPALWPEGRAFGGDARGSLVATALLAAALVVAVAIPVIGMWAMLLLFLSAPVTTQLERRLDRHRATRRPR